MEPAYGTAVVPCHRCFVCSSNQGDTQVVSDIEQTTEKMVLGWLCAAVPVRTDARLKWYPHQSSTTKYLNCVPLFNHNQLRQANIQRLGDFIQRAYSWIGSSGFET
jgi:hypothetical protein